MSLRDYRSRRNFEKTTEPIGAEKMSGGQRFVVQKHEARQLHYDLRLEKDGVLRSWAVPKGLPLEPGLRRLAVQVEDHPLDYIDFTGAIPQGEYGAGVVEVWDTGQFDLRKWTDNEIEIALHGRKLEGTYVLIHTKDKDWIVLKKRV